MLINIIIADDHSLFSEGVQAALQQEKDINIVEIANNGNAVLKACAQNEVDVVLMDIGMPILDGIETTKIISQQYPKTKVIALTMFDDIVNLNKMISAGAYGYLLKSVDKEELCLAIRKVKKGDKHFSSAVTLENVLEKKKKRYKETYLLEDLSAREREILMQLARGKSSNDIAKDLNISIRTVETHRANIMKKIGVHNTSGLVRYAYSIGIS